MQPKAKKIIFIAVLLAGCIITSLISTNDKAKNVARQQPAAVCARCCYI